MKKKKKSSAKIIKFPFKEESSDEVAALERRILDIGISDGTLFEQIDDMREKAEHTTKIIKSLIEQMKQAKDIYASASKEYTQFCADVETAVKAEGRLYINKEEKAQIQIHAEKFQQAKESVASLNVEMLENLNKMKAISERYKDDVKELRVDDVVDSWRERSLTDAGHPISPNRRLYRHFVDTLMRNIRTPADLKTVVGIETRF